MIDDTPFMLLHTENAKYLAIGKYRMEDSFESVEEALDFIGKERTNWKAITFVLAVIKSELEEYINLRERSSK